jgi:hypothetical protein
MLVILNDLGFGYSLGRVFSPKLLDADRLRNLGMSFFGVWESITRIPKNVKLFLRLLLVWLDRF